MAHLEAVRVAQDVAYAASLSDADWQQLAQDPTWQELVAEQSEMVSSVIAVHGHKLPGAACWVALSAARAAPGGLCPWTALTEGTLSDCSATSSCQGGAFSSCCPSASLRLAACGASF